MLKAYEHNAGIIRHLSKHNDDSKKQLVSIAYCYIVTLKIVLYSLPMIDSEQAFKNTKNFHG